MRKQKWMRKGGRVLAHFKKGTIVKAYTYKLSGQSYVYLFQIQLDGEDFSSKYHPDDVELLDETNQITLKLEP